MGQLIHLEEKIEQEKSKQHPSLSHLPQPGNNCVPNSEQQFYVMQNQQLAERQILLHLNIFKYFFKVAPTSSSPPQKVMRLYP